MNLLEKINARLSDDANKFASIFNMPRISPWIISQYKKGYKSIKDYKDIVNWITNNNPNINDYDFNTALTRAREFSSNVSNNQYDPYMELHSNNVALELNDGKKWLSIDREDCNAICHRLQYDCSKDLKLVYDRQGNCWSLQDPQDKTICIMIHSGGKFPKLIGQFGKKPVNHKEIKALCVLKGLELPIEAFSKSELPKAINNKEINLDEIEDIRSVIKSLTSTDIINCNLLNYAHYCTIKTIYDIYNKTNHSCLLKYAIALLISHGLTNTKAYSIIKTAVNQNPELRDYISNIQASDSSDWIKIMEEAMSEIQEL